MTRNLESQHFVKLEKGFDLARGGKLPGFCGGSCTTGCRDIRGVNSMIAYKGIHTSLRYIVHGTVPVHDNVIVQVMYRYKLVAYEKKDNFIGFQVTIIWWEDGWSARFMWTAENSFSIIEKLFQRPVVYQGYSKPKYPLVSKCCETRGDPKISKCSRRRRRRKPVFWTFQLI